MGIALPSSGLPTNPQWGVLCIVSQDVTVTFFQGGPYIVISGEYTMCNICNQCMYNVYTQHIYCSLSVCVRYIPRPSRCLKSWIISDVCVQKERLYTHISIKIVSSYIFLSIHGYMWVIFVYIHMYVHYFSMYHRSEDTLCSCEQCFIYNFLFGILKLMLNEGN